MFNIYNFFNNDDIQKTAEMGPFQVLEYIRDLSVTPQSAMGAYFCSQMNVRKKQVVANAQNGVLLQAGAMQWTAGDIQATTGIKGAGDFLKKAVSSHVTGESATKPEYIGPGFVVLEPTFKHILLVDVGTEWNGGVVLEDGLFLACEKSLQQRVVARQNLSSALGGGEGMFNLALQGAGVAVLESPVPQRELVTIDLENDVLKVDGSYAIMWSPSLQFTVERSSKSLLGSAATGEGLVNVFRGTGRVVLAPVQ